MTKQGPAAVRAVLVEAAQTAKLRLPFADVYDSIRRRIIGQLATPILWVLVVAPALASTRGAFNLHVDYFTFLAAGQVAFLIPFTAMFNGINVIVGRQFGVLPEILSAPIHRALIPLANAVAVLLVTAAQVALIVVLGRLRGAHFHTSMA